MPSRIYSKLMSHESATRKPEDLYFSPTQSTILKQKTLRVVKQKRSFKYGSPTFEERLVDKDIIPRLATAKTRKVSRGKQSITFQRRNPQKNMVNIWVSPKIMNPVVSTMPGSPTSGHSFVIVSKQEYNQKKAEKDQKENTYIDIKRSTQLFKNTEGVKEQKGHTSYVNNESQIENLKSDRIKHVTRSKPFINSIWFHLFI